MKASKPIDLAPDAARAFVDATSASDSPLAKAFLARRWINPDARARRLLNRRGARPVAGRARTLDGSGNRLSHSKRSSMRMTIPKLTQRECPPSERRRAVGIWRNRVQDVDPMQLCREIATSGRVLAPRKSCNRRAEQTGCASPSYGCGGRDRRVPRPRQRGGGAVWIDASSGPPGHQASATATGSQMASRKAAQALHQSRPGRSLWFGERDWCCNSNLPVSC